MNNLFSIIIYLFFIILGISILIFILFHLLKKIIKAKYQYKFSFKRKIFLITVPKKDPEDKNNSNSAKELLKPMENFFDTIAGLKSKNSFKNYFTGYSDIISFEVVANKQGLIFFYAVVPETIESFFKKQLHAQFPDANIEETKDYNIFLSDGKVAGAMLGLKNPSVLPINTYIAQEYDPMNSVINSLSKIPDEDAASIQFVVRSANKNWHDKGAKIAQEMQSGKSFKKALGDKSMSFFKIINGFFSFFFSSNNDNKDDDPNKNVNKTTPQEQEMIKSVEKKASKAGLEVNIRIVVSGQTKERAKLYLDNIVDSFSQFSSYKYGNSLEKKHKKTSKIIHDFIYRNLDTNRSFILNTEEMTSVYHFPLKTNKIPNIKWLTAKKAPAPAEVPNKGVTLGKNIYRGETTEIKMKKEDRRRHIYEIGKTGTGKSYFMTNLAIQDIRNGEGVCLLDPHGDLIEDVLEYIPKERAEDVIYFNPADTKRPMGLNLLQYDPNYPEQKTFLVNEIINIFDKLYDLSRTGGPIFEQYMRNACLLIMSHPESGSTLMEIPRVLSDTQFRKFKLDHCDNQIVKNFWIQQAEKAGGEAALENVVPYVASKLNQFVANDIMRPIIGQQKSAFNLRKIMDEGKILLVNLSKGKIGEKNAYLLGLVLVGRILMSALGRTDMPENKRKDFYLYIDEFQNFITESINTILAEARKYRLNLIMAHQFIGQLVNNQDTSIRDSIFGNVGTTIAFNVGIEDAEFLEKQFKPVFNAYDLANIEKYHAYIKLLVDNQNLEPFNISSYQRKPGNKEIAKTIKHLSVLKYGRDRSAIKRDLDQRNEKIKQQILRNQ